MSEETQNGGIWADLIIFGVMWFVSGFRVACMVLIGLQVLQWGRRLLAATETTAEAVKEPEAEAGSEPEREEWKR